jgi:hypothetical protein
MHGLLTNLLHAMNNVHDHVHNTHLELVFLVSHIYIEKKQA